MASNDSNALPTKSQTTSPGTKKNNTTTTTTPYKLAHSADQGLTDIPAFLMKEAGKMAQVETKAGAKEVIYKTPPPPATCTHRYALEVWIKAKTSPNNFMPPEEESYSADFIIDTLNLYYPGCTGVYLAELGHAIAFYC